ncbi:uncharacterized protein PG986_010513 [Apiospora aurea]|uniref:Uncharacterized protein n=1 Tax=Apiospora aurea TaxID=335848 RepID=A0ABR1Q2M4_9PEZI
MISTASCANNARCQMPGLYTFTLPSCSDSRPDGGASIDKFLKALRALLGFRGASLSYNLLRQSALLLEAPVRIIAAYGAGLGRSPEPLQDAAAPLPFDKGAAEGGLIDVALVLDDNLLVLSQAVRLLTRLRLAGTVDSSSSLLRFEAPATREPGSLISFCMNKPASDLSIGSQGAL